MFDRRLLTNFDWSVLTAALLLIVCGILLVFSANYNAESIFFRNLFLRQIYWSLISLVLFSLIISIDYHHIVRYGLPLYILNNLLLIYLLLKGDTRANVNRWISIMGISIQPSEFAKIILILILAGYLSRREKEEIKAREIASILILLAIPLILVVKQPDLGSALVLMPIFVIMLMSSEASIKWLIFLIGSGLAALPLAWYYLKPYQLNRLLSFIKPNLDPLGIGYQVLQAKIAVGAGQVFGQGFLLGTQSQLHFIPQHHTDFIFSVLAEEWGFLGCLIILVLFLFVILKGIDFALNAKDRLGRVTAMGIVAMFTFHVITNIGMVIGLLPVTGIPLPFLSYGGTSLIANMVALGLLLNIRMRRFS